MAALITRRRPNGLMAEALAVALITDATIAASASTLIGPEEYGGS
ncbi:MAG: hypothetical protein U5R31_13355 [Acidimicrobiia bacterium]|nr:hypothetical protein [Acidimicrobiia bacterium]